MTLKETLQTIRNLIEDIPFMDEGSDNKEALIRDKCLNDIHGLIYDYTLEPEKDKELENENGGAK